MKKYRILPLFSAALALVTVVTGAFAESWKEADVAPIGNDRMEGTIFAGIQPNASIVERLGEISDADWAIGPEDAPLTILMYSDFQCPYCSLAGLALLEYQAAHADEVRYVYRHFPLPYHAKAPAAAYAANAAGKQDEALFFEVEHLLYEEQAAWAQLETDEEFEAWIREKIQSIDSIDYEQWEKDFNDETMRAELAAAFDEASATGLIEGTPTLFLNMNSFKGGWEAATLDKYLSYFKLQREFYTELPPIVIDAEKDYRAVVETTKGTLTIDLLESDAPAAVNNFVFLASEGWYDGNPFYRVEPGFIAETGDKAGSGLGNPGYYFAGDENDLLYGEIGMVGMVNGGEDKNGSKFFLSDDLTAYYTGKITALNESSKEENRISEDQISMEVEKELAKLSAAYPIFGRVVEGAELIPELTTDDSIVSVRIEVKSE